MEKIIEKLLETRVIYDTKLDDAITALKEMDVKDENFDKILNRVSSLISLNFYSIKTSIFQLYLCKLVLK